MSMNEALAAATINAAHSIGRGATHGSIQVGKVRKTSELPLCYRKKKTFRETIILTKIYYL